MAQNFSTAIAALRDQLQKQEREVRETKRLINKLSTMEGTDAPYPDADAEAGDGTLGHLRRDQFYGVPLATAIQDYLKMRRVSGLGPGSVNDIYAALCQGGFNFETRNEANAKRGLYISLAKNAVVFHKLPGGTNEAGVFGLTAWYPKARSEEKAPRKGHRKRAGRTMNKAAPKGPAMLPPADVNRNAGINLGKKPEKGIPHDDGKSAGPAARQKHNLSPSV